MKNKMINSKWVILRGTSIIVIFLITIPFNLHAQGIIDFDSGYEHLVLAPDNIPGHAFDNYTEKGFLFTAVNPTLGTRPPTGGYDSIWIIPAGDIDPHISYNPTAYLTFEQARSPDSYVSFSQTSSDAFGLVSVQLANLLSDVTFVGIKTDGSRVYQVFDASPASPWQTYYFDSDFFSDLVSVDIKTTDLFMDNLTFIPEPATVTLLVFGFLAGFQAFRKRRQ